MDAIEAWLEIGPQLRDQPAEQGNCSGIEPLRAIECVARGAQRDDLPPPHQPPRSSGPHSQQFRERARARRVERLVDQALGQRTGHVTLRSCGSVVLAVQTQ